ncbi:dynein regulatory complex subunit 3 isoform X1 [Bemisia tabaci]|uniref:dynein regulatory complex subunit 3 isoform X1 n=1 Tax=Bemisia tabaci TaxID=7038 RepID=UPI003B28C3A9
MTCAGEDTLGGSGTTAVISVETIQDIVLKSEVEGKFDERAGKRIHDRIAAVNTLRLEFRGIICIDSLWMLTNLTELYLNNNSIQKIENIENLVNLTKLDLSFNQIKKIENLEEQIKLSKLSLSYNQISKLENLDNCPQLKVLVCSNNLLADLDDIQYLRKFEHLRTLTMIGNPFSNAGSFVDHVAKELPQLVYLNFQMLRTKDGKDSRLLLVQRKFADDMSKVSHHIKFEGKIYESELELHTDAFVEYLEDHQLFDSFGLSNDLREIYAETTETQMHCHKFQSAVFECTHQIFELGLKQLSLRIQELNDYNESMTKIEQDFASTSSGLIDQFGEEKNTIFSDLKKHMNKMSRHKNEEVLGELKKLQDTFETHLQKIWFELMRLEDIRSIQIKDLLGVLKQNIQSIVKDFTHNAKGYFSQIREHVNYFILLLKDHVQTHSALNETEAYNQISEQAEAILERLNIAKEMMYNVIDKREDTLIISAWDWYDDLFQQLEQKEFARSRNMILQINTFSDFQLVELSAELSNTAPQEQTEFSFSELQMIKDLSQIV